MGRLTKIYSDGTHGVADHLPCGENSYEYKQLLLEALGKYEDLEEQGLLLRLPCKVGRMLYVIEKSYLKKQYCITEFHATSYTVNFNGAQLINGIYKRKSNINSGIILTDFIGETVFLTRKEAEAKLKELEESNER